MNIFLLSSSNHQNLIFVQKIEDVQVSSTLDNMINTSKEKIIFFDTSLV